MPTCLSRDSERGLCSFKASSGERYCQTIQSDEEPTLSSDAKSSVVGISLKLRPEELYTNLNIDGPGHGNLVRMFAFEFRLALFVLV